MRPRYFLAFSLFAAACVGDVPISTVLTVTDDGAWCWFQDPRAVFIDGEFRRTYAQWVTTEGTLEVGVYDHDSDSLWSINLRDDWGANDHNVGSFLVLPDRRLMAFHAQHNGTGLFSRTTIRPEDISEWGPIITVADTPRITYSHPVYLADEDAFKDHHGYVEESFEIGFPRFKHGLTKTENYDPSLWFIAWDGDEVAGISICRPYSPEDKNMGWVEVLGVRRPWRKQGLGEALLQYSFGKFYARGKRKVGLGVDASSLTGALRLYEKVGMSVFSQFDKYAKEIRAGEEISLQSIEE
jgi:ribosomal protein S18 acetylase RimI-like enzyme